MNHYHVDDCYRIIEKPNENRIGVMHYEPDYDCEILLFGKEKECPKHINDKKEWDGTHDCPVLIGNYPCNTKYKCKITMWEDVSHKNKKKQIDLFNFTKENSNEI